MGISGQRTERARGGADTGRTGAASPVRPWWRDPLIATGAMVPLYVLWAGWLGTGGGDLAAQVAWTGFVERHPSSAYNLSWYGGTHTANYSVLAPPLMAVFGVRAVSVAAGLGATWALSCLLTRALRTSGGVRPLWPALLGAFAIWCNIASGRTTFALGVALGLVALVYLRRPLICAGGAALATLASPVAGLFLVVAGAAQLLDRRWRRAVPLLLPPAAVVAATTVLFPFGGEMPMPSGKLWMPLLTCAALVLAAPPKWRVVRHGAAVYAVGVVLTYVIASPIGTNVERLVGLAGPPVLLAALLARASRSSRQKAARLLLAAVVVVNTWWLVDKTDDDLEVSTTVPAWARNTDGVLRELARLGADRTRVEVVPARNHREAAVLSPHISMAKGWNRQLDVERGRLFYDGSLTESSYRQWLDRWAVGLVVLPHGEEDGPAKGEAAIVRGEPEWLERVWRDAHWTVYRVRDAVPLVSSPGEVTGGDSAELAVRIPAAGSVTVRVAYSPWLRAEGACLEPAGEWTRLTVTRAGEYRIGSPWRLPWADRDC